MRGAFAEAVNRGSYSSDPGQLPIHAADLSAAQPWAASYQCRGGWAPSGPWTVCPVGAPWRRCPTTCRSDAARRPRWTSPPAAGPGWSASAAGLRLGAAGRRAVVAAADAGRVVAHRADRCRCGGGAGGAARGGDGAGAGPARRRHRPGRGGSLPGGDLPRPCDFPRVGAPGPGASAGTGTPEPDSSEKPLLRQVNPVTVLGPSFATGDDTYTMAFRGWPFAFRTPGFVGLHRRGGGQVPGGQDLALRRRTQPGPGQRVDLVLRQCTEGCPATRQKQLRDRVARRPGQGGRPRASAPTMWSTRATTRACTSWTPVTSSARRRPAVASGGVLAVAAGDQGHRAEDLQRHRHPGRLSGRLHRQGVGALA